MRPAVALEFPVILRFEPEMFVMVELPPRIKVLFEGVRARMVVAAKVPPFISKLTELFVVPCPKEKIEFERLD